MISRKYLNISGSTYIERPLAYEYDSSTESVVLLTGFLYVVVYKDSNKISNIDLRDSFEEVEVPS